MTEHESTRITRLLEQGSDGLEPDVAGIVARGRERGRQRVRRGRIGASLAAAALVGVVAVSAAVVPSLLGDDPRTMESGFADDGPASDKPSPEPTTEPTTETSVGPAEVAGPARPSMRASDIPALVRDLYPGEISDAPERTGGILDNGAKAQVAHFLWNGFLTSAGVNPSRGAGTPMQVCRASAGPDMTCQERDGSAVLTWQQAGPAVDGGVTGRGVSVFTPGFEVWAVSYNAADGKESPVLAPEPPFGFEQLEAIASDAAWFA